MSIFDPNELIDLAPCVDPDPAKCRCGDCLTYLAGEVYAPDDEEPEDTEENAKFLDFVLRNGGKA